VAGDVIALSRTEITPRRRMRAAVLATDGVLSHASAAQLWDLPVPSGGEGPLQVTVPVAAHPRVAGVRVHRRPLRAGDRSQLYGLPLTARPRTVVDCLASWPRASAEHLLNHVLRTAVLTVQQIRIALDSAKATRGVGQARHLFEQSVQGSWSAAEGRFHELLRANGITGWAANHRLRMADGRSAVIDVWFEDARLAVEVDGQAWHVSAERFQRDRSRQNALVLAGCTVLRFTWADITQTPHAVVAEVRAALPKPTGG
jgi:very-short-patch-repair endonuclease